MTKQYVTVELCDADDVIGSDDAVKYVRMALDYYQSQATMDLYKVRPAGPSLGGDDSTAHNTARDAIALVKREVNTVFEEAHAIDICSALDHLDAVVAQRHP